MSSVPALTAKIVDITRYDIFRKNIFFKNGINLKFWLTNFLITLGADQIFLPNSSVPQSLIIIFIFTCC